MIIPQQQAFFNNQIQAAPTVPPEICKQFMLTLFSKKAKITQIHG